MTGDRVESTLQLLRQAGVDAPSTDRPVRVSTPDTPPFRQVVGREDVTGRFQLALNNRPGLFDAVDIVKATRPPACFGFAPCWLRPGCCVEDTEWFPPRIDFGTWPVRIPEARLHVFSARLEGEIRTRFDNRSEPGEKQVTRTCFCQGGDEGVERSTVDGSATLDSDQRDRIVVSDLGETLDKVRTQFNQVPPDRQRGVEASFDKRGALEVLQAIVDIMLSGSMVVDSRIEATVSWMWRGKVKKRSEVIRQRVRLPVDRVNVFWD